MIQDEFLLPCAERELDVFVLRPPDDDRAHPTALLIAGSEAPANVWRFWGKRLAEQGIAVVGTAQPGFGRSEGPWDFAGAPTRAALDALLAWIKQQPWVDAERIAFGGYSSGATNAFLLAARAGGVVGLVGAAGVYDLNRWIHSTDHPIMQQALQALDDATDAAALAERSPVHIAAQLHCPIRLIHGGKDDVVPAEQAELMAAALRDAGNEPDVMIYPERGHSSLPSPPFVDFLAERLKAKD
jgi:dipeptidyl aminopeptidase/acylaminoacyl peptidase